MLRLPAHLRLVSLLLLGVLAACGMSPPASERVQFSGEPIRVGLLHSLSGTLAISEIPVRNAALLAIDAINARGGVIGRQILPVIADGASDPATFAREAERLIQEEGVAVIFGCWTSVSRKAVLPIVEANDAMLWYPVQYEGLEQSPNIVYLGATANQQIVPAVEYLFAQGKRRFFLLGSDYVFPRTANAIITAQLADLGAEVVGEEYLPLGAGEFAPVIAAIAESQADVVFNTLNGDSNVAFFRQLQLAGLSAEHLPVMSVSIAEPEVRAIGPELLAGHFATWNYFQSLPSEENRAFVQAYRADYGQQQVTSDPMAAIHSGVHLWAAAAEAAGSFSREALLPAAANLRLNGVEGQIQIDLATQHLVRVTRIGQVDRAGQFVEIWRSDQPIAPDPFLNGYPWASNLRPPAP